MIIDIQLIPLPPKAEDLLNRTVVVADILRSTSVMVHTVSQGVLDIIPMTTVEEAFQMAKHFEKGSVLLGGEWDNQEIPGFDLGNSPLEYTAEKVSGKKLIMATTNGTRAFQAVSSGKEIFAGSFLNVGAIARRCLEPGRDLFIFPAGDKGKTSLEDTLFGGMLIDVMTQEAGFSIALTDASQCARTFYREFKDRLQEAFHLSNHGQELLKKGFEEDLEYCSQIDLFNIVPEFKSGVIKGM